MIATVKFITSHPLNQKRKLKGLFTWLNWQVKSRLARRPLEVSFVNDSKLLVSSGMTGATGNIYTGLQDFSEMSLLLHILRRDDLFIDIGANVGSYTVLASAVVQAKTIAIEPIAVTYNHLLKNVALNQMSMRVEAHNIAVGEKEGVVQFTSHLDTVNHVVGKEEAGLESLLEVPIVPLDKLIGKQHPTLIKIDVEGFESQVVAGAIQSLSNKSLLGMIMEFNGSGNRYGQNEEDLHKKILAYGFKVYQYEPFQRTITEITGPDLPGNRLYLRNIEKIKDRIASAPSFSVFGHQI